MAFDQSLADRIARALSRRKGIEQQKMFGGVGFLLNGNMCVGVWKDSLIVRLAAEDADAALSEPHARPFDITGRPMKGWLLVGREGVAEVDDVKAWVRRAVKFVGTLPTK